MNMTDVSNISGVDRYMEVLVEGLSQCRGLSVTWLKFVHDRKMIFMRENQRNGYKEILIPLPQLISNLVSQPFWMKQYCRVNYHLLEKHFVGKEHCILHLHTFNLIDFALYVKERISCKIVSHIHCIPWKSAYNSNTQAFNRMYKLYYLDKDYNQPHRLVYRSYEQTLYTQSDSIVCVSYSSKEFINRMLGNNLNISVVYNGIKSPKRYFSLKKESESSVVKCLYVGALSASKGLDAILRSLQIVVARGYKVSLTVVGKCFPQQTAHYYQEYPDVPLEFKGLIGFEELQEIYRQSNIGLIASLQEQCSYAAIEMMMFGLPVISTAVDALEEMFVFGRNALKVPTVFSEVTGLSVDIQCMANQIITLVKAPSLRRKMGQNSYKRYCQLFTLDKMISETLTIYHNQIHT